MKFDPTLLDAKWQKYWRDNETYRTETTSDKPKYYVLDMFPYPSGAGLHVGHPLGYIASDIYSRYKRQRGFNVLHPMGFDAFGLPAEQYAIDTGVHPSVSTEKNMARYKDQMERLALSFDWSRAVNTSDPKYYKWTQWTISRFWHNWYDKAQKKARPISELIAHLEANGTEGLQAAQTEELSLSASDWKALDKKGRSEVLMNYRLAYRSVSTVNWCEELGSVLANDEVKDGKSERGGHPVEQRPMVQWSLRITAYAERLLQGLDTVDYSEGLKAQQANWIGKSTGALAYFDIEGHEERLTVYTTRPDTIFGVTFMVLAPEHEWVDQLTTPEQQAEIDKYQTYVAGRTELERQQDVKTVSGAFTGSYCINPLNGKRVPIYIAEYVLKDYGTGAIMAVPSDDERDKRFAEHFGIEIIQVVDKTDYPGATLKDKVGVMINSGFMNGMQVPEAIKAATQKLEEQGRGQYDVNYRIRDLVFSRQRYWGEPWPIVYDQDGVPEFLPTEQLPVELPPMEDFRYRDGKAPLERATDWVNSEHGRRETDTMPATAGSNWYYLRYMDPHNEEAFVGQDAVNYWQDVDLYLGGVEHAVSHILYSRLCHKLWFDIGLVPTREPYKKLFNQGMIGAPITSIHLARATAEDGSEHKVWVNFQTSAGGGIPRMPTSSNEVSQTEIRDRKVDVPGLGTLTIQEIELDRKVPLRLVEETSVDNEASFRLYRKAIDELDKDDAQDAAYFRQILSQGEAIAWTKEKDGREYVELSYVMGKMSKSKYNVINPDDICARYGVDCFRMYEMFLGPLDQAKPWSVSGIDGVYRFLRRFWGLFYDETGNFNVSDVEPGKAEMKSVHTCIQKVTDDIEKLSFNTCVSAFMVATNELIKLKANQRDVLEPLVRLIAPFAPHLAEELYAALGHDGSVHHTHWPAFEPKWLVEDSVTLPIAFNGKTRFTLEFPADADKATVEAAVLANAQVQQQIGNKSVKRVIVVPGRMVNMVVG
ncbi:MAG: class I tRNA ligase family protein [Bacteroidota bacterium]